MRAHKKPWIARWCTGLAVTLIAVMLPVAVFAHPLGNFTINHYAEIHVAEDELQLGFVLDMAEIPAFQEIQNIDLNRDGVPDSDKLDAYRMRQCQAIGQQLDLSADGIPLPLQFAGSALSFPPGVGGLATLRLTCEYTSSLVGAARNRIQFTDNSYQDRLGWREIVVVGEVNAVQGEFLSETVSNRLQEYPTDLLSEPLNQRAVTFQIQPEGLIQQWSSDTTPPSAKGATLPGRSEDGFTQLITLRNLNPFAMFLALAIAVMWGGLHALSPGHGKTIVGAYLVGSRGNWKHALFLGLATTATHTTGVFALGLITLFASKFVLPEQLYPWLSVTSGLLVVAIGINLFASRARGALASLSLPGRTRKGPVQNSHHLHTHPHGSHEHDHVHHEHTHGHDHTHALPGADGAPITWRSLAALGISGGLLPCPSALVVMLSAIALERVGFGLILVLFFSVGLASVLTAIGLLFIYAGRLVDRLPVSGHVLGIMPAVSALIVTVIGLGITIQAMIQAQILAV